MAALLQISTPSTITIIIPHGEEAADHPAVSDMLSRLAYISCFVTLLLEGDFEGRSPMPTTDSLLLPCLLPHTRSRFRRLACHMGLEVASMFYLKEAQKDSSDEDFPGVRHRPIYLAHPTIRYLEVLKVSLMLA